MNIELEQLMKDQDKEIQGLVDGFRALTAHPAWPIFVRLAEKHIAASTARVIGASALELAQETPPTTTERLAGQIQGMRLAINLPALVLQTYEESDNEKLSNDVV